MNIGMKPGKQISNNPPAKLLTPKETAALLAISERKLWSLTKDGNLPLRQYQTLSTQRENIEERKFRFVFSLSRRLAGFHVYDQTDENRWLIFALDDRHETIWILNAPSSYGRILREFICAAGAGVCAVNKKLHLNDGVSDSVRSSGVRNLMSNSNNNQAGQRIGGKECHVC